MRKIGVFCAIAAVLVALAACGSSSTNSTSGGSTSGGSTSGGSTSTASKSAVDAASSTAFTQITGNKVLTGPATQPELDSRVTKYEQTPTKMLVDTPVSKKATPGKTLDLLVCGIPVCSQMNDAASQAAKLLGWTTKQIPLGVDPSAFTAAYTQGLHDKPNMVIGSGTSSNLIQGPLHALYAAHIPVLNWSVADAPIPGKLWTSGPGGYRASGLMAAEFVAQDSKLAGQAVVYSSTQYAVTQLFVHNLINYGGVICPKCSFDLQEVQPTQVGSMGSQVVAYLQAHPDVKYVIMGYGGLASGVGQAVKSAGITGVKIIVKDPSTTDFQNIKNGLEYAAFVLPATEEGYLIVDMAQRIFNGQNVYKENATEQPIQIVKADTITNPASPTLGAYPGFINAYKKLWRLG